jgi:hypothetical protein
MVKLRFRTRIQVGFADGGTAVVASGGQSPARIGIVLKAWALLYRRDVRDWKRTTDLEAEHWYDGRRKRMRRYDDSICSDLLDRLIPVAIAFQRRQREVVALWRRGRGIKDIARHFKMPVSTVSKMLKEYAARPPVG